MGKREIKVFRQTKFGCEVKTCENITETDCAVLPGRPLKGKRAVFLDRDGVINRAFVRRGKPFPPASVAEFELLPGVPEACRLLKNSGFLLVVVTNQPDVGRGLQSQSVVEAINAKVFAALPIDRLEVCYDAGRGETSAYRKPAPGMLRRAATALGIDLVESFMVGDRWSDINCGRAAGCKTFFIDYSYAELLHHQPDFRVSSLLEAATIIVKEPQMA
jgi:D-glycero-D-manno-heptose 1,7-bisphosphate phosphatase